MTDNFNSVLNEKLRSSPFWSKVGFRLESSSEGRVRIQLPYDVGNTTAATALHGGAIAATLDAAGCLAAWSEEEREGLSGQLLACDVSYIAAWMTTELGRRNLFGSTLNTKIKVFAPLIKRDVIVRARAVGGSGSVIHSDVDILSIAGEPVASGSTIYRIVDRG